MLEVKKLVGSQVEIKSEIAADEFDRFFDAALKEAQRELELPGFRKGAAPMDRVIAHAGEEKLLWEAAREAINKHWPHIIEEAHIEQIGKPQITITKIARGNALGFTIIIATLEKIILPDYRSIAKEIFAHKEEIVIDDEEVTKTLDYIKETIGKNPSHPYHALFAKADPQNPATRELVRQNIYAEKELRARDKKRIAALDAIAQKTNISLPDVVVESELASMFDELKKSVDEMALPWDKYLEHVKKNEEDLKKEWHPEAERRAKFGIILREIARAEKCIPDSKVVSERAEQFVRSLPEEERKNVSLDALRNTIFGRMQHEMVFDLLEK